MIIELNIDQDDADEIVRLSLMEAYRYCSLTNKYDCSDETIEPDQRFLAVLDEVIEYYSSTDDYAKWQEEKKDLCQKT